MCIVYRDYVPFEDLKLQNECEMNDISRLKGLYRILHGEDLENLAKMKQVARFILSYKVEMKSANP